MVSAESLKCAELQLKFDGMVQWIKAEIWLNGKWNMTEINGNLYMTEIWLTCNEISWLKYEWMVNEIWIKYDCNQ